MVFSICPRISSAAAYRRWWTNNLSWNIVASVPQVGDKKQKQQRLPKKRERKLGFFCLFKKRQTPTYSEHQPNSLWTVKKPLCYLRFGPFKIGAYTECASRSHIFGSYNSKIQITSRLKQSRKKSNIKAELNSCSKHSRFHIDEAFQYAEHWGFIYRNNQKSFAVFSYLQVHKRNHWMTVKCTIQSLIITHKKRKKKQKKKVAGCF